MAETYDLLPFENTTQTMERTLVDKVFAVCDYYIEGNVERHSRHLYDIHKIVELIGIPEMLTELIPEVRAVRSEVSVCHSAISGIAVSEMLREIVERKIYKEDYESITSGLLFVPETYNNVIESLKKIADSRLF